jgi:hypothetical protein
MKPINNENLLIKWYELQTALKKIKDEEMQLRKVLFTQYFPHPTVGTNKLDLPDGYVLEGKYTLDYKLDIDDFKKICVSPKALDVGLEFEDVVDLKEVFNATRYKQLAPELQSVISEAVTVKPACPTLAIVKKKEQV